MAADGPTDSPPPSLAPPLYQLLAAMPRPHGRASSPSRRSSGPSIEPGQPVVVVTAMLTRPSGLEANRLADGDGRRGSGQAAGRSKRKLVRTVAVRSGWAGKQAGLRFTIAMQQQQQLATPDRLTDRARVRRCRMYRSIAPPRHMGPGDSGRPTLLRATTTARPTDEERDTTVLSEQIELAVRTRVGCDRVVGCRSFACPACPLAEPGPGTVRSGAVD
ncbi:uncharacterized protein PSFLO_01214 [Pseudozyma flocculosa]|uniref:Uncharacterized protein n=1 Tax=Pseudozyma flocculosa TaxID=84751 RepID=A0A5C3ETQ5_9BASI|nr:uncharacterized protein PSFLO_01214 [Pseudozyma flocculosa]